MQYLNIHYNDQNNDQTAFSIFPPLRSTGFEGQATPTLAPTPVPQSTNLASSNNEIPLSKELVPSILGLSSRQEELITPTTEVTKQINVKKEIKKSANIWDYVWLSITSLILGGIGYLYRKKILKK